MSFSYDLADLGQDTPAGRLALVRLKIGDTVDVGHYLEDEEINAFLTLVADDPCSAAILSVQSIIARLSGEADYKISRLTVFASQPIDHFEKLLNLLQTSSSGPFAGIFVGGINRAANRALDQNNAITHESFQIGMDDDIGIGRRHFGDDHDDYYGGC